MLIDDSACASEPLKLLLVEDTDSERFYLSELLNQQGFQVTECRDGEQALAWFDDCQPDIVVSDWRMPGMSGLDLCRLLKQKERPPYVLMLTANSDTANLIQGIESGADDYLGKPFLPAVLKVRLLAARRQVCLNRRLRTQYDALRESLRSEYNLRNQLLEDLQNAASLQRALLPAKGFRHQGWSGLHHFASASHLAGDLFNVFPVDENHLGFFIADISGHGTAAALQAFALGLRLGPAHVDWRKQAPSEILSVVNRQFTDPGQGGQFATVQVGRIDCRSGDLVIANAAHPRPLLWRSDGCKQLDLEGGLPLGIEPEFTYQDHHLRLEPGDRLLLVTDGTYEGNHATRGRFGVTNITGTLMQTGWSAPEMALEQLFESILTWQDYSLQDDVSLLMLCAPEAF
ncbi:SpoIIE family protein phosphatase [Alloalcanivorax sp. C16-2]|uniref:SpoIIE family protein phosphatase n=1 Tax=Alloalcanivorax TaxID=3020832 RepID=UPI0019336B5F|nr:SpoIIE family protein phosphatase [Alloalcanivorax marinus]MBL7251088.1 SpoIIE family protein phosphatase [Alloalcanivorax marinus]